MGIIMEAAEVVDTTRDIITMEEVEVVMIIIMVVAIEEDILAMNCQRVQLINYQNPLMAIMMRNLDRSILRLVILTNRQTMLQSPRLNRNWRDQNQRINF